MSGSAHPATPAGDLLRRADRRRIIAVLALLPVIVWADLRLCSFLDPAVFWLAGRALGPLIESLDVAVALNLWAMMGLYIPALSDSLPAQRLPLVWRLFGGIVVGWSGALALFANLSAVYLTQERDVLRDSVAGPTLRLEYLVVLLMGTTAHISTALHHRWGWWKCIGLWSATIAVGTLLLTAAKVEGWV